ncbi:type IV pilin [Methanosarcina sp.]|uniref:type IV pilin n=1 Tax=Methanosarcina sp. TaxID=2213 RepID=UPI002B6A5C83|nr:type IV pilin [Methanosarcina sp.]HOW14735.1 type IV pilin [Methanosarcina sp.]
MDLKKIFFNDKAVSPVIGVVLMVAITVILAAAIGSSVFGQGPSESAPQANIDIIVVSNDTVKLEHLGGDTILLTDGTTKMNLAYANGTSVELDIKQFNYNTTSDSDTTFEVGMTKSLQLRDFNNGNSTIKMGSGDFATIKIVDVKTQQLIADKELRF